MKRKHEAVRFLQGRIYQTSDSDTAAIRGAGLTGQIQPLVCVSKLGSDDPGVLECPVTAAFPVYWSGLFPGCFAKITEVINYL